MKRTFSILFILASLLSKGQSPSFFRLGEDEFSGIDIYDLHQDKADNYWIATAEGMYRYNGYDFIKIHSDAMLSSSVFNVKSDKFGERLLQQLSRPNI